MSDRIKLFHASIHVYKVGDVVSKYQRRIRPDVKWIEQKFEERRPKEAPSRYTSVFAFDNISNSSAFIDAELRSAEGVEKPTFYQVNTLSPWKAPMVLIDRLKKADQELDISNEIVDEYWNPKLNWQILEFLCEDMEIVRILEAPNFAETAGANFQYGLDMNLAKRTDWKNIKTE